MSSLDSLFEQVSTTTSVFLNRDVLSDHYQPETLVNRESEILTLGSTLAPSLRGLTCSPLLIIGGPGTGKTAITLHVVARLNEIARRSNDRLVTFYVDCRLAGNPYGVISVLCRELCAPIPSTGLSIAEGTSRFFDGLIKNGKDALLLLDELDYLVKRRGDTLLYHIARQCKADQGKILGVVGVGNSAEIKELLTPGVASSMMWRELRMKPYTADELEEILVARVRLGFRPGSVTPGAISLCAAMAAADNGDARKGLSLLKLAGELADADLACVVSEDHVRRAQVAVGSGSQNDELSTLPLQSKALLVTLALSPTPLDSGSLFDQYCNTCRKLGLPILSTRRVRMLVSELHNTGLLHADIRSLGRGGRTKNITLAVGLEAVKKVLNSDPHLSCLFSE